MIYTHLTFSSSYCSAQCTLPSFSNHEGHLKSLHFPFEQFTRKISAKIYFYLRTMLF